MKFLPFIKSGSDVGLPLGFRSILTIWFLIATVGAAPGDVDSSFGTGAGKVTTALGGLSSDFVLDSAIQSDGKIISVGYRNNNNIVDTVILRHRANGLLDTTFNNTGIIINSVSPGYDQAQAVAIQPDGKILVGGYATNGTGDFMILRYTPNGAIDLTFGESGYVFTDLNNGSNEEISDIFLQPDGKILAVGHTRPQTGWYELALARYHSNGALDASFGSNGIVIHPFGVGDDYATEAVRQSDGKIVLLGRHSTTVVNRPAVLRFEANGALDASFDVDGVLLLPQPIDAAALVVQPDSKIVVSATTRTPSNSDFAAVRILPEGQLDPSFGNNGFVMTQLTSLNDTVGDAIVFPDGKIMLGGGSEAPPFNKSFSFVRYNSDGTLDAAFGTGGILFTPIGNVSDMVSELTLQADQKVVASGFGSLPSSGIDVALARYETNGSLDKRFGFVGLVTTPIQNNLDEARAVEVQTDGKVLTAGGSRASNGFFDCALTRHNADGTIDTTFGSGGKVLLSLTSSDDEIYSVALQTDGKIVATGYINANSNRDAIVLRLNPNGTLDTTFSNDGIVTLALGTGTDIGEAVVVQSDGKIAIGGYSLVSSIINFTIARLNPDGALDLTFDNDGVATAAFAGGWGGLARDLALQPDGKLVLAGDYLGPGPRDFGAMRFNSDGSLDSTFGVSGKVITPVGTAGDECYALELDTLGRIVLAGFSASTSTHDFSVVRYNPNGTLDTSFDGDGKTLTPIEQDSVDEAFSVLTQPDGKIVVGGISVVFPTGNNNFTLVRYNVNGSLDGSFGNGGKVITDFGRVGEVLYAVALQRDGKILAAGGMSKGAGREFALVRYTNDVARALFDFDGDGRSDLSVFRPSNGVWYVQNSSGNPAYSINQFGISTDLISPGDFDGDGKTDLAVFRESNGYWYLNRSASGFTAVGFGLSGDKPVAADYDGDGKGDVAVFRPSSGTWWISRSSDGGVSGTQFGTSEDIPTIGDFDGDGKADVAIYRPSNGVWYRLNSGTGQFVAVQFGTTGDKPTAADFDGDGKTDVAVFRPSNGVWYILGSTAGFSATAFGTNGDKPVAADYDGDGKSDVAAFRPSNGTWYLLRSTAGFTAQQFGTSEDRPTPNAFVP